VIDHYATLGVARDAGAREVSRAYRRLARRYHPDVSSAPPTTLALFLEVQNAYETLSDTRRRASYDAALARQERPPAQAPVSVVVQPPRPPPAAPSAGPSIDRRLPSVVPSTVALTLVAGAAGSLTAALILGAVESGVRGFLDVAVCSLLAIAAVLSAHELAARQLERLWRAGVRGGSRSPAAVRRIRLADDATSVARRALLFAVPLVFLLTAR